MNAYAEKGKGLGRGEMRNCRRCGKVFISFGSPICPECIEKEEEQYEVVRQYLIENPNVSVSEVSDSTGVPPELIIEFLRRGLLMTVPSSRIDQKSVCIICKRPLESGRICPQCQKALLTMAGDSTTSEGAATGSGVSRVPSSLSQDSRAKMYIIDMIRGKKP